MSDIPTGPVTYEARETKRARFRTYIVDSNGKTLLYSAGSFTNEDDALRVGEIAVSGNEDALKAKLEAVVRTHLDDLARLAAARRDLDWEKRINRWVLLSVAAAGIGILAYTIVYC